MKQRHSFCRLEYHLVFHTKQRQQMIRQPGEIEFLLNIMRDKAHELDSYIQEGGGWKDHLHLLIESRPTVRLSEVYGQLKGKSAFLWRKKFPGRLFKWGDGVFAESVDPGQCDRLRIYIRSQWRNHEIGETLPRYERMLQLQPPND